ncbi:MAG: hypothetical protein AAFU57_04955, partial [Bacteroidota bacterium]
FLLTTLIVPSALLIGLVIAFRKSLGLFAYKMIILVVLSILAFRFMDLQVRSLIHFSTNHILNTYLDVIVFGLLSLILISLLRKIEK